MANADTHFAGSIPALYDRCLGPLLFQPYARAVASRARRLDPSNILETAAGTGIVTAALHEAVPEPEIVATDLNPAMLEVARTRVSGDNVAFQAADALDLPFGESSFDLVVCQFGGMFFPDKVRGHAEARRVLRDGGPYLCVVWDRLENNLASDIVQRLVDSRYEEDPPRFLARTPFGYADPAAIERDLQRAGFGKVEIETLRLESDPVEPADAARGLVAGCPLRGEIEERDPGGLESVVQAAADALGALGSGAQFRSTLSAHLITARK